MSGNVKALVPLFREKLHCENIAENNPNLLKFQRGKLEPLYEKHVFGVITAHQVGYVPNVKVNFTENEETFCQDTYVFKSLVQPDLSKETYAEIDIDIEIYKEKVLNEYEINQVDEED